MDNFKNIQHKLEAFIKRFYTNELLKGAILFFAIGLLYFLFTVFIEYVLWLNTTARSVLFWLFIGVELALLVKFIVVPLAKLFKLQKGINYKEASKLIGEHFPEVNDKLLNVLQLNESDSKSELLLASIDQKSLELNPIPFKLAINFRKNLGYLKYAAIPVLILLLTFFTGNFNWFSDSYTRVVNYKTAYEPPAPFHFFVVNQNLNAIENKDFKLIVKTAGEVMPESAQIIYNNETYFLQQKGIGEFEYIFPQPKTEINFQLSANKVTSKRYTINVVEVPSLLDFEMVLDFPSHTSKKTETLKSTGNAIVPEGTEIIWKLKTKSTTSVNLFSKDTIIFQKSAPGIFGLKRKIFKNFSYTLSTSNADLTNYENLAFNINVVKDEFPELKLKVETDSVDLQSLYFYGQVSDDYGFSKLQLVYYPSEDKKNKQIENIPISNSNISEFISAFPNNLKIEEGISYNLYFQVFDNDLVNRFKSTKSKVFSYRKRTKAEEEQKQLEEQKENIQDLNKSLENFEKQEKQLQEVTKTQKEKSNLNFNDKKKLESFFKRQKEQDEMMKNFNKKLKDNLDEFQKDNSKEDEFKEDLKKRLEENEEKLKEDEKLLEQLKHLQQKIRKDDLVQKLDELAKQNKNKKKSLQQLLELTKRFYVEKKLEKLKEDLMKLALDQEKLANKTDEENTKEKQDALNKEFEKFKEDIKNLEEESKGLKKPIDIPRDKLDEKEVENEQKKASEALDKKEQEQAGQKPNGEPNESKDQNSKDAKDSQKKAAKKMKQMSEQMGAAMSGMQGDQMQEDVEMLRQVLDNLVLFSFDQEALMNNFKSIEVNNNKFASYLKKQNNLKENFEHVDDSLFALSLRQPKISETVNKEITEVYYNIDRALDLLAENRLYQGVSNQQFAITAANNLANILSDVLDNMQESMSMSMGKGQDGDMQLPDIIMSQEQLNKMMQEGMKKGENGKPKSGEGKKEGEGEKDGEGKKEGEDGKDGSGGDQEGKGENGNKPGEGQDGFSEDLNGELFKIYQQQQELREALEEQLNKEGKFGKGGNGDKLVKQMEDIELELLNKGFNNRTLQKMMQLKHQLLKLERASFQQGEDNKRESESNTNEFNNSSNNQIPTAKQYFNTTEILNRQSLPLQQIYKQKVQEYFKQSND
ncbi:glutamyl-tRNA synthetase [Algibacter lectus]|uniref:Liver stage antigen putative n=1 Tax=Algibacter lectus TaxID=221126 RepID=A0A090VC17_9FLAO|nr:glutamyl-tRNA synthetase [Algibacter lectus]GAL62311.1 liver stage antigen putative [Algibacter lectus]